MLSFSKHTDYALIALAHLRGASGMVSASQIASSHGLPLPMVMALLKRLQRGGLVRSARGVQGGYELAVDLHGVSLYDLTALVQQPSRAMPGGRAADELAHGRQAYPALQLLKDRLNGLLRDVGVLDLLAPGRRIDVPLERVRCGARARGQADELIAAN
jgi:Rrf2 family protein